MRKFFRNEILAHIREPFALFFTIILPIGMTLIYGKIYGAYDWNEKFSGYDATMIFNLIFLSANIGIISLAMSAFEKKATFTHKRYLMLPISKTRYFLLNVFSIVVVNLVISAVVIILSYVLYDVTIKINLFFIIVYVLVSYLFFIIGYIISLLNVSPNSGQAIGLFTFFVLLFFSGMVIPLEGFSSILQTMSEFSPMNVSLEMYLLSNDLSNISLYAKEIIAFFVYLGGFTLILVGRQLKRN